MVHFNRALWQVPQGRRSTLLLWHISAERGSTEPKRVKRKLAALTANAAEEDLFVDLTFHDVPAGLLMEFAEKIVQPYYAGNLNRALKDLIEKAITEQQLLQNHTIKS